MCDMWTVGEWPADERAGGQVDRETTERQTDSNQVRRGQMEAVREWPGGRGQRGEGRGGGTQKGELRPPPPSLADPGGSLP